MQFKKYANMDVTAVEVSLHPKAKEFLFEHYATLRRIFPNVLGQLETDYISIALINQISQIFFLSSKPSIEQNLIEKELWQYDEIYQPNFIYQDQPRLWTELTRFKDINLVKQYKQKNHGLLMGISIPTVYTHYRAIFSFGFKKVNPLILNKTPSQCEKLLAMGKYCIREIGDIIPFPDEKKNFPSKPTLELIINNQVIYERNPG